MCSGWAYLVSFFTALAAIEKVGLDVVQNGEPFATLRHEVSTAWQVKF